MPNHSTAIEELEPKAVWRFFSGIAATPRPSKCEEKIRKHIQKTAAEHGLAWKEDAVGNLLIDVAASPGHEDATLTVLQAHLDMVCEKNSGTSHDFDRDPIRLVVDKEKSTGEPIVRADATTLGADNGIGVAMALAAATSTEVVHGPLELLFTVDEEAGMTGAKALVPEFFRGRRLLNLDSEEDDRIYIGCAGGCDTNLTWNFATTDATGVVRVVVCGLRGGHSGCDIQEGRGSAIKVLARTLLRVADDQLRCVSIQGGSKRNAIAREAEAMVVGGPDLADRLRGVAKTIQEEVAIESLEPAVEIMVETGDDAEGQAAMSAADTVKLLAALSALPQGVLGMHPRVEGLVETSNNVSTIQSKCTNGTLGVDIGTLTRSSSTSRISEALEQIASIGRLSNAKVALDNDYPGWSPNPDSPTLALCRKVYENQFAESPEVAAIHAGLECGLIGERVGQMDMVSFGPTIVGAHSPDERVFVSSVQKSWRYLCAVLKELA